jgi:hypothetical protein
LFVIQLEVSAQLDAGFLTAHCLANGRLDRAPAQRHAIDRKQDDRA